MYIQSFDDSFLSISIPVVGQQFIHHLCHVTHYSDSAAILHTSRSDHAEQTTNLAFLAVASHNHTDIFHLIPLVLTANNDLYTVGFTQMRGKNGQEAILL